MDSLSADRNLAFLSGWMVLNSTFRPAVCTIRRLIMIADGRSLPCWSDYRERPLAQFNPHSQGFSPRFSSMNCIRSAATALRERTTLHQALQIQSSALFPAIVGGGQDPVFQGGGNCGLWHLDLANKVRTHPLCAMASIHDRLQVFL